MKENDPNLEAALEGLDASKRATLKGLIGTGAFVGPIVVSFSMADLTIDAFMHVAAANATTPHTTTTTTAAPTTTTPGPGTTTPAPGTTTTTTTAAPTTTAVPRSHPTKS
jgi:hypothetical protein